MTPDPLPERVTDLRLWVEREDTGDYMPAHAGETLREVERLLKLADERGDREQSPLLVAHATIEYARLHSTAHAWEAVDRARVCSDDGT